MGASSILLSAINTELGSSLEHSLDGKLYAWQSHTRYHGGEKIPLPLGRGHTKETGNCKATAISENRHRCQAANWFLDLGAQNEEPNVWLAAHVISRACVCPPISYTSFYTMPDNNIDPVVIWRWLRRRKRRNQEKRKHWVHPFFRNNLNSRAYIVSKEFNHDPELLKSFYRTSTESFSLLVHFVGPQIWRKYTNFRTGVSAEESLLITLR
jgi:hypothetical protein